MVAFKRVMALVLLTGLAAAGTASGQIKKELNKENQLVLTTPMWQMVFDGERGGELSKVMLSDGDQFHRAIASFAFKSLDTLPALSFTNSRDSYYSGKWDVFYANEGRKCQFKVLKEAPGEIHFQVSNRPRVMENGKAGPWIVTYTWHVYDVGVVFCDFEIKLPDKETFELAWSLMGMHVEDYMFKEKHQGRVSKFSWNWGQFGKTNPGGRWQPAVLSSLEAQPLDVDFRSDRDHKILDDWTPYGSSTFNLDHWPDTAYTNAMEVVFEEAKPLYGGNPKHFGSHFKFRQSGLRPPPTWMGSDRNPPTFSFEWNLYHGPNVEVMGPMSYTNRFGVAFSTPRMTGSPKAHPILKNRLQAARIFHWVNAGKSGAAWYPKDADLDKMKAAGADVLILGLGWKKPGVSYQGASAADLKRVCDGCHARGIRVGLSMRGEDYPVLEKDMSWFTRYLRKDSDGIYVIHPGFLYASKNANLYPVEIKGEGITAKGSTKDHVEAYVHFLWTKKLRNLVGPNGFLIGETSPQEPTRIGMAYFDAYAPGIETLFGTTDRSVYARFRTGNGCTPKAPIGRRARSDRAVAFAAAYGDCPQVMLGEKPGDPTDPADAKNATFVNLWKLYASADLAGATAYNTVSTARKVFRLSSQNVAATLYHVGKDEMMLLMSNLGPTTDCEVKLDFKKLGIPAGSFAATVTKLGKKSVLTQLPAVTVQGGVFKTGDMGRFDVLAFHLKRQ